MARKQIPGTAGRVARSLLKYWSGSRCCSFWRWPRRECSADILAISTQRATPASAKTNATRGREAEGASGGVARSLQPAAGMRLARLLAIRPFCLYARPAPVFQQAPRRQALLSSKVILPFLKRENSVFRSTAPVFQIGILRLRPLFSRHSAISKFPPCFRRRKRPVHIVEASKCSYSWFVVEESLTKRSVELTANPPSKLKIFCARPTARQNGGRASMPAKTTDAADREEPNRVARRDAGLKTRALPRSTSPRNARRKPMARSESQPARRE